ncbi:iron-sulfur cluster-binding oxidoreductase [Desulfuromonas sp. AOP6]|uniref:iron-sulfur cluster-binding oxidoreductase n=1 Tax=Desulfuromonas sp. AOP6 TaxID=1566351 RepID=UPI001276D491|nr:iron-sulfur cluster-binding oxidoreductase [Desulfuromonas sp. AOP6]BCA80825.1 iron-sulfur cluster-binding oxidoreductase [Desulfuromonas sp. AOP6]
MKNLACGCPGSHVRTIEKKSCTSQEASGRIASELRQWPTQLALVPPTAPWLQNANLLIAADCTPFAYAEFHRDFIKDKVLVNACPKLDDCGPYVEKLTQIFTHNDIQSVTITIMEVPCCRGMVMVVKQALEASGKDIPVEVVVIGVDGERRNGS